ncbi:DedA family protein [Sphingomonas sanxanigenens]|uniref:VTT domain-containing protein n=1 Tax=Sphingomonas sanxanigenens DSM 19645 = NX02 TaxID=1123269 RepID=W0A540_9SPHN|nr:DedA family protein [Sphingomonas sanxanigenens]AHE52156.1 hypothetical protein NX02_01975 [Sphingomonas sanxanigenens DSM 19645 = NX02]
MTNWISDLVESMGYLGIGLLMFLENLFPPIPSELIMPLAGYSAAQGKLSLVGVLLSGMTGTVAGALFWYSVARIVNEERLRRWADRHGRWLTLDGNDISRLEDWFCRHRNWAVPSAHVIPGLRTLISIPAGIFEIPLVRFIPLTILGSGLWTCALGLAGYALGERFDAVDRYLGPASSIIMACLLAFYFWRVARFRPDRSG